MGTGGCLGPVKNRNEIYIKLITQMYEQGLKITNSQSRNLDLYLTIKQKITKKGYLRKFIDNLSTHRHKILDSMNFNYKITSLKKQIERHYVGLVIADAIIQMIYHSQDKHQFAIFQQSPDLQISNSSSILKKRKPKLQILQHKYQIIQQNRAVYNDQYFKLIFFLYENQKRMHLRLLQSMITFFNKQQNPIDSESYASKIVQKMSQNIKQKLYLSQSCHVFYLLLAKTKDEPIEKLKNQQILIAIINTWLRQRQKNEADGSQILMNCQKIIGLYINRCISSWDSVVLYEILFTIYDDIQFSPNQRQALEIMYEQALRNSDFKTTFFRGQFNYLLAYLSITNQNYIGQVDRKWFSNSLGLSYQKMRNQYKNLLKQNVKIQCFKLINIWVDKKYVDINQYCLYNSKALLFVYLQNCKGFYRNKTISQKIIQYYLGVVVRQNIQTRCLFVERIFEQFQQESMSKIQWEITLRLVKQIVYKGLLTFNDTSQQASNHQIWTLKAQQDQQFQIKQNRKSPVKYSRQLQQMDFSQNFDVFLNPILLKYNQQIKLQLLKLMGFIIQNTKQIILNEQGKVKLCEFLYSIYENISVVQIEQNPIVQNEQMCKKYEFLCTVISVFRNFAHLNQVSQQAKSSSLKQRQKLNTEEYKEIEQRQLEERGQKLRINIAHVLKVFIQKVFDLLIKNHVTKNQKIEISNSGTHAQYFLVYMVQQLTNMLLNSGSVESGCRQILQKMYKINQKIQPYNNSGIMNSNKNKQRLEQYSTLMKNMQEFLHGYWQDKMKNISLEQSKSIASQRERPSDRVSQVRFNSQTQFIKKGDNSLLEQCQQYKLIFGRCFSNKQIYNISINKFRLDQLKSNLQFNRRDSDAMSQNSRAASQQVSLYNYNPRNSLNISMSKKNSTDGRCDKCRHLASKCLKCCKEQRISRGSDKSFNQVIDVVRV